MKDRILEICGCVVIIAFALLCCFQVKMKRALATPIPGTVVSGPVVPGDTADTYPSHINNYGKGGPHFYLYTSDLRAIPDARRERGMLVWINEKRGFYQLYTTPGHFWRPFTTGGTQGPPGATGPAGADGYTPQLGVDYYDGRPGAPPLFCNLSGGTRAITYDQAGLNPSPAMQAFGVQMWAGGSRVDAIRTCWVTGPAPRQVFGSGCSTTFTPSVATTYDATAANNWVQVQATYSTVASAGGKRICIAGTPIAVTKIGQTGLQGPPGQDATVTEPAVITAFAGASSDNAFRLRPASNTGTVSKLHIEDYMGNVRFYVDSSGTAFFKDANGKTLAKIMTDGTLVMMDSATYQRIKLDNGGAITIRDAGNKVRAIISGTSITTFHTDGTTPAFQFYSTGKSPQLEPAAGNPAGNSYCWKSNTDGTRSWGTCEPAAGNPAVDNYCWKSTAAGVRSWGSCGSGSGVAGSDRQFQYNSAGSHGGTTYTRYTSNGTVFNGTVVIK